VSWLVNRQVATALKDLVDTTAGRDGPDLWVLYRENYTVVLRNVAGTWKGTHGGATWKVQHIPLIMSGPSIRRGVHSQFPARSVDIAPTMERLLGLPPVKRDGVVLADALTQPTDRELAAQKDIAPALSADVGALRAQSNWDSSQEPNLASSLPPRPYHCSPATNPKDRCHLVPPATNG
jgi:hypothetical protein